MAPNPADDTLGYAGAPPDPVHRFPGLALSLLSCIYACIGRWNSTERLTHALRLAQRGRALLTREVLSPQRTRPDDVTVVLGVRDRADYRLTNALRSLRAQRGLPGALRVLVVDYGSSPAIARRLREECERHAAECLRVDGVPRWSRSRCLNVGIRRTASKFVMTSDVDVVLSPDYLAGAIRVLNEEPLSVVCSAMLDLPESSAGALRAAAECEAGVDVAAWRRACAPRLGWQMHPSIAVTFTAYLQLVRGYDEFYELWGREDADLMRRLHHLGLQPLSPDAQSFYLHQWHPKFEGIPAEEQAAQIRRNNRHYARTHGIVRNRWDWGAPGGLTAPM